MTPTLVDEAEIVHRMEEMLGDAILEVQVPRARRIFGRIKRNSLKTALRYVTQQEDFHHISTITAVDLGAEIEVIYHLSRKGGLELSLKVRVSGDNPVLPTITDILPGAILYEREVHDLFGVVFEDHPDLSPLLLPEKWPSAVYPLRKTWTIDQIEKVIKGGKA